MILRVFLLAGDKKTLDGAAKDAFATVEYLGNFSFFASPDHHAKNEGASLLSGDFDASDSYHNQVNSGRGASLTVLVVPYNMDTGKVEGGFFDASGATVTLSVGLPK